MEKALRKIAAPNDRPGKSHQGRKNFSATSVSATSDLVICATETTQACVKNRKNTDGIIIAGFSDVGVDAIKEMLDIPVLGIADLDHIAALISHRFSVLTGRPNGHRSMITSGAGNRSQGRLIPSLQRMVGE